MGQRLIITIRAFDEDIAAIYYHWSAYTLSALYTVKELLENVKWKEAKSEDELIIAITRFLEKTSGCVDGEDMEEFKTRYPTMQFKTEGSRNDGLISISDAGIERTQGWAEGNITIDFDEETIYNDTIWWYGCKENFEEEKGSDDDDFDLNPDEFPKIPIDPNDFKFSQLDQVIKELDDGSYYHCYNGEVYENI